MDARLFGKRDLAGAGHRLSAGRYAADPLSPYGFVGGRGHSVRDHHQRVQQLSGLCGGSSQAGAVFLYLWKYTGICALILKAAAANIDPQLAEAAAIEGASKFTFFRRIYLFQILPHIKFLFVFDLIGFFRLFRESYLLYGLYPPQPVYFIQNYLYNNFSNLNFQKISTASVIMMGALAAVNFAVIKMGDRNEAV